MHHTDINDYPGYAEAYCYCGWSEVHSGTGQHARANRACREHEQNMHESEEDLERRIAAAEIAAAETPERP